MYSLDESQAGIKIARKSIHNLRYADDTILMAKSEEKLKSLLMRMTEKSEKADLKLREKKKKKPNIKASVPITSWQIEWGKVEIVIDFIFLGSKITVDGDCTHKFNNTFTPWKKSYDKPREHIEKQRSLCQQRSNGQSYDFSSSHVQV